MYKSQSLMIAIGSDGLMFGLSVSSAVVSSEVSTACCSYLRERAVASTKYVSTRTDRSQLRPSHPKSQQSCFTEAPDIEIQRLAITDPCRLWASSLGSTPPPSPPSPPQHVPQALTAPSPSTPYSASKSSHPSSDHSYQTTV